MAENINSKGGRSSLKPRREPYWSRLSTGLYVGFRKLVAGEGTWIARSRMEDGKQKYQSIGTFDAYDKAAKSAQEWARKMDAGIEDFGGTVEAACKAYVEYIGQHKSAAAKKDPEGRFQRLVYGSRFGQIKLDKLKSTQVREWLQKQTPEAAKPEALRKSKDSANRNLNTLKAALNRALNDRLVSTDAGWRTVNRFPGAGKSRDRLLRMSERRAIVAHCTADLAALIKGLLLTLSRPGEIASAKVGDFDPARGTLNLDGKTGARTITLSTEAIKFFKSQSKGKLPSAPLLSTEYGQQWNKDMWKKPFKAAVIAAKLPEDTVIYHLRHAAISEAISGGMDPFTVAKLAGTSTTMIDKHYGHLRHDITRSGLDALKVL